MLDDLKIELNKAMDSLHYEFGKIRTGRANPDMLEGVLVEAYGTPSPINQVALVSIPEARQLLIKPFDPSLLKDIEAAINKSDLGINPINDGDSLRLNIPSLTEETRKELTKKSKQAAENAKIKLRNARKDINNAIKKSDEFTDDEKKKLEKQVQEYIDEYNKKVDEELKNKDQEIMKI